MLRNWCAISPEFAKFQKMINLDSEWLKTYVVFRLMFNYGLNKFDIEKINSKTYDLETGIYKKTIHFDSELVSIFKKEGINFLAYDKDTIYLKLDLASDYLGKKITQEVIRETKKRFQLLCPYCGEYFNNDTQIFGIAKIDILNLNGIVVCKNCLDKI